MQVDDIKLKDIDVTENVRLSKGDSEIKQLMESIKQHGLKEPIGVMKNKKEGYTLLYGFRRFEAYKKLGYVHIPAVIAETQDEKDHLIINTIENIQRRNVTPYELGRICVKLQKLGLTVGEISARLNATKGTVDKAITIYNRVPASLRDKIAFVGPGSDRKGMLSAQLTYNVMQFAKTAGLDTKETHALLMAAKDNTLSSSEISNIASLLNTGIDIKEALKKYKEYKVLRIDITVKESEFLALKKKYNTTNQDLVRMMVYGMADNVSKPSFIKFTTIKTE